MCDCTQSVFYTLQVALCHNGKQLGLNGDQKAQAGGTSLLILFMLCTVLDIFVKFCSAAVIYTVLLRGNLRNYAPLMLKLYAHKAHKQNSVYPSSLLSQKTLQLLGTASFGSPNFCHFCHPVTSSAWGLMGLHWVWTRGKARYVGGWNSHKWSYSYLAAVCNGKTVCWRH